MIDELIAGFEDFKRYSYDAKDGVMQQLIEEGQSPRYFIISCIDSRANPGTIFRPAPGAFFAHKAMGAIVRPYKQGTALSAALRFALDYNKVQKIIVLGHTECGAIKALADNIDDDEISSFIEVAQNALIRAKACTDCAEELLDRTVEETVIESAQNLMTYPAVNRAVTEGRAEIVRWVVDMKAGDVLEYRDKTKKFEVITTHENLEDSRKNA
ncbi:MAG: hypothetical protein KTR28_07765 [Micavibrio sp.]|nr:hypothetical protein [Micavibrio sp.]